MLFELILITVGQQVHTWDPFVFSLSLPLFSLFLLERERERERERIYRQPLLISFNDDNDNNDNDHIKRCNSRFFTISSLHHKLSPTHMFKWPGHSCVQIMCNTWAAHHVNMSCATLYEGTHLGGLMELKSHLFWL